MKYKIKEIQNYFKVSFLKKYLVDGSFVAGGCFKNILNDTNCKDIDLFFVSEKAHEAGLHKYKSNDDFELYYETDKVHAFREKETGLVVELINTIYGTPTEVLNQFDFTVTKFALFTNELRRLNVVYHEDFFEHLQMKRLVIDNLIPFPFSTFERSYKYRTYGYNLCSESKVKLLEAIRLSKGIATGELSASFYDGLD